MADRRDDASEAPDAGGGGADPAAAPGARSGGREADGRDGRPATGPTEAEGRARRGPTRPWAGGRPILDHPAFGLVFFLALSVVWSWPLALHPAMVTVALHFDQFPAAWLVYAAPTFTDGLSELAMWPDGQPLVRLDSFLFLALAFVLNGQLPGLLVTNLFVLLGPPISAWAAERFAREVLDVPRPASLIAGIAFGFAPLATVAALEGHVYYLLDPWLPLCALYTWQKRAGPAVACFALALASTAYLGVNALLLMGVILAHQRRLDARLLSGVGVIGGLYAVFYVGGQVVTGATAGGQDFESLMRVGSASLTTLVAWNAWIDQNRHSLAPILGLVPLCFALLAPVARVPWRPWLPLGLLTVVLTFGPVLEAGVSREGGVPTPLWPLHALGVFDVYRFPVRFGWVTALVFGALAARVAGRMRWAWLAVGLAAIDAIVVSGAYTRMRPHPTPTPSLYGLLPQGAVLDLYPRVGSLQEDIAFYQQNLSCYYQIFHGRPILERCLNTDIRNSPRLVVSDALHAAALDDLPILPILREQRIASVVLHADLYQPFERAALRTELTEALGEPMGEGHDGGEWLVAWRVPTDARE